MSDTIKARVFNICQFFNNPRTGDVLISDEDFERIKSALYKYKTLKQWAWIVHEQDTYSQADEDNGVFRLTEEYHEAHPHEPMTEEYSARLDEYIEANKYIFAGKPKPKHLHIVISTGRTNIEIAFVCKWLGIPMSCIDLPKGRGAFLDCVKYLTHEDEAQQAKGKHLYSDEEVEANFEWRSALIEREDTLLKYGDENLSVRDKFRHDVLYNGMSLKTCSEKDRLNYMNDYDRLEKNRLKYIADLTPPTTRINYYICGRGGLGKGLMSRAIARSLFPELDDDDDIFFNIGAGNATFEGYDGQPVIIWNDFRAGELLKVLGGRGNVFNVFDTHPTKQRQNIKYGSINLCNKVNIVNSVDDFQKFLNDLAGEYISGGVEHKSEDKGQAYRRFPIILPLYESDFDMYINKGFLENSSAFTEFIEYKHIRGNLQKIAEACGKNEKLARAIEGKTVKVVVDKHNEILQASEQQELSEEDILAMFADYGEQAKEKSKESPSDVRVPGQISWQDYMWEQVADDFLLPWDELPPLPAE